MPEIIRHSSSSVAKSDFRYINKLAQDNYVGHGPLSRALESRLAERFSRASVILAGSGEAALALALHQLHSCNPDNDDVGAVVYVIVAVVNVISDVVAAVVVSCH